MSSFRRAVLLLSEFSLSLSGWRRGEMGGGALMKRGRKRTNITDSLVRLGISAKRTILRDDCCLASQRRAQKSESLWRLLKAPLCYMVLR